MSLEYCCECGNPTGNAGRLDDSIYIAVRNDNGEEWEVGPLCAECRDDKFIPVLYERA